jgi:hypothetical protein
MAPSLGDSIIATAHCVDDRVVVVVVLCRHASRGLVLFPD